MVLFHPCESTAGVHCVLFRFFFVTADRGVLQEPLDDARMGGRMDWQCDLSVVLLCTKHNFTSDTTSTPRPESIAPFPQGPVTCQRHQTATGIPASNPRSNTLHHPRQSTSASTSVRRKPRLHLPPATRHLPRHRQRINLYYRDT